DLQRPRAPRSRPCRHGAAAGSAPADLALGRSGRGSRPLRRAVLRGLRLERSAAGRRRRGGRACVVGRPAGTAPRVRGGNDLALLAHLQDDGGARAVLHRRGGPRARRPAGRRRRGGRVTTRILRVLAPNPSVYTLEGTNTWIVGGDPSVVIDPGPDDASHLQEVAHVAG